MVVIDASPEVKSPIANFNQEQGERLTDLILRKSRLALLQAVRLADSVCRELILAHELQIVHGNIEPSNLWVKLDGQTRLGGFDFSYLTTNQHNNSQLDINKINAASKLDLSVLEFVANSSKKTGNLYYMAPEQGPGSQVVTRAADIYSFGATLYSAVTGHHYLPFHSPKNQLDYLTIAYNYHLVCERPPQPVRRYNSAVTESLEVLIGKCLEKQPEDRYPSIIALKQALREVSIELEQHRDRLFNEAKAAENSEKWHRAVQLYEQVLAIDEWHNEATLARIAAYQKLTQPTPPKPNPSQAKPNQVLLEISYPRSLAVQPSSPIQTHPQVQINPKQKARLGKRFNAQLWERCLLWSLPGVLAVVGTVGLVKMAAQPQPKTAFYAAAIPVSSVAANPPISPTAVSFSQPSLATTMPVPTATTTDLPSSPTATRVAATQVPAIIAKPIATNSPVPTPVPATLAKSVTVPTVNSPTALPMETVAVIRQNTPTANQAKVNLQSLQPTATPTIRPRPTATATQSTTTAVTVTNLQTTKTATVTQTTQTASVASQTTIQPIVASTQPTQSTVIMVNTVSTPTMQPTATTVAASSPVPAVTIAPATPTVKTPTALATGSIIWPIRGVITTYFSAAHPGIDIASSCGTPTQAADGGTVVEAGWSTVGYGNTVVIDHGNGMRTRYAHFAALAVIKGDIVTKGEIIGYEGSTGNSTGCHVHFEVWVNNVAVNPLSLLPQ